MHRYFLTSKHRSSDSRFESAILSCGSRRYFHGLVPTSTAGSMASGTFANQDAGSVVLDSQMMTKLAQNSYMKQDGCPPLQLEELHRAVLLGRELRCQHRRWPSSRCPDLCLHQGHLDLGQSLHHPTRRCVGPQRNLRQAHEHQAKHGREGMQTQRSIGPLV